MPFQSLPAYTWGYQSQWEYWSWVRPLFLMHNAVAVKSEWERPFIIRNNRFSLSTYLNVFLRSFGSLFGGRMNAQMWLSVRGPRASFSFQGKKGSSVLDSIIISQKLSRWWWTVITSHLAAKNDSLFCQQYLCYSLCLICWYLTTHCLMMYSKSDLIDTFDPF